MFKLDRPFLNDWFEVAQRKLVVMSSIRGLCVGKRKISNSWYLIVVEDVIDEKYDVFDDHFSEGVKWRYQQHREKFCT